MVQLEEIYARLAQLVVDRNVTVEVAAGLGRVRDDLASQMLAAAALDEVHLSDESIAGMLRRGVITTRSGINAITEI